MSRIDQVDPHCPGIQEGIILYIRSDKSIAALRHRIQQMQQAYEDIYKEIGWAHDRPWGDI